jgi:methylenetetrahydrofolate dehydrogenase (NADP+)/methenyltetrahydrofolate cyclohydrolase
MAQILDGKTIATNVRQQVAADIARRIAMGKRPPALAVVLVGDDPASAIYVRNKHRDAKAVGMRSVEVMLPAATDMATLLGHVHRLSADPEIDGILVQLPLPAHLDPNVVINAIDPDKDVDGLHPVNAGRLSSGLPSLVSCTPRGSMIVIQTVLPDLSGLHLVMLGRSNLMGKPMAQLALAANATVTIAHSKTRDLPDLCRLADILVAAVGRPEMVRGNWIKPGAVVIDVGINRIDLGDGKTRVVGDVCFSEAAAIASAITPVPGGIGPMTIACLLQNTLIANQRRDS